MRGGVDTGLHTSPHHATQVWHTVSVPARKPHGKSGGSSSPPVITLSAGEVTERFGQQPPIRPSVLFGANPARETKVR